VNATELYASPCDALVAAIRAAKAECCGLQYVKRLGAWVAWVKDYDAAERMAGGLRLTGYDVTVKWGYTTEVQVREHAA
jgi:hypothetical protein